MEESANWIIYGFNLYSIASSPDWFYGIYILQAVARKSIHLDTKSQSLVENKKHYIKRMLNLIRAKLLESKGFNEMK